MMNISHERYDKALRSLVDRMGTDELLAVPGLYEALSEELNNEILAKIAREDEEEGEEEGEEEPEQS